MSHKCRAKEQTFKIYYRQIDEIYNLKFLFHSVKHWIKEQFSCSIRWLGFYPVEDPTLRAIDFISHLRKSGVGFSSQQQGIIAYRFKANTRNL